MACIGLNSWPMMAKAFPCGPFDLPSGGLARFEEGEDVSVLQVRGGADSGQEALAAYHRGGLRAEGLEGHLADVPVALGAVSHAVAHAAADELPLEPVADGEGGLQ